MTNQEWNVYKYFEYNENDDKINTIPKYIQNKALCFGIDLTDNAISKGYISYIFENVPFIVVNTIRRYLMEELYTLAYDRDSIKIVQNNTELNNDVILNMIEYQNIDFKIPESNNPVNISLKDYNNSELSTVYTYNGIKCNAMLKFGKGVQNTKWNIFNAYFKYMNIDDIYNTFMPSKLIKSKEKLFVQVDIDGKSFFLHDEKLLNSYDNIKYDGSSTDKNEFNVESLNSQRNYIKVSKTSLEPKYICLTVEKLLDNVLTLNYKDSDSDYKPDIDMNLVNCSIDKIVDIINIMINKLKKVLKIIQTLETSEASEIPEASEVPEVLESLEAPEKDIEKNSNLKVIFINNETKTLAQLICFILDKANFEIKDNNINIYTQLSYSDIQGYIIKLIQNLSKLMLSY